MGHLSDNELHCISRTLSGDRAAFEPLHAAYAGRVSAYFLRSGFPPADAEDLTQEVFLRALRSLGSYNPLRGGFAQWLWAIARNVARKHWSRCRPETVDPELAEATLADAPAETPEQAEELRLLDACIRDLPAELQKIVELRYVHARTTRAIAEAVGMPEATVRLRLDEARQSLARRMAERGVQA